MTRSRLGFAVLMSWRESRAAPGKFIFLLIAVALGTAALTAVTGFNESVRYTLLREARTLMAADVTLRLPLRPSPATLSSIRGLESSGIRVTNVTETVTMASAAGQVPVLVSVKGANLEQYPFYGRLLLDPPDARLDQASAAVSEDLLLRLGISIGSTVRLGEQDFRIAARIASEPDRMTTGFTLGPRVLLTQEGLRETGIITPVSRVTERILLKLPENADLAGVRSRLVDAFGSQARIADYTETNPVLTRALTRATRFLSMVSLIALIVGGLGVGSTMQTHLRQRMTAIAFMKCIGARSGTVLHIYAVQAVLFGLAGSAAGALLGVFAQSIFARFVAGYFDVEVTWIWPIAAMVQSVAAGVLIALLFSLPPLLAIRRIRPSALLRRDFGESGGRLDRAGLLAGAAAVLGLWGVAVWISGSVPYASIFAGSLAAAVLVLAGAGALLLRALRGASRVPAIRNTRALRHGVASLQRPGANTVSIVTILAIGVMFSLTVYFVQHSLLDEIRLSAPPDAPNVFLVNVTEREKQGIADILASDPSVLSRPPLSPAVTAQLLSIDGTPVALWPANDSSRRFQNTPFVLTWSRDVPAATEILEGEWWKDAPEEPLVSVNDTAAENLNLRPGNVLEWISAGNTVRARVANIRRTDGLRAGINNQFILSPGSLDGIASAYFGAVRVAPAGIGALQVRIFSQFPTVTVVNAADILAIVQDVIDRTSQAVRFVAGFAILGGLIVLASSVAGTRSQRMREAAILKTVGGTRAALLRIFSVELAVLGLSAGLLGSLLATMLSAMLVGRILDAPYHFRWLPALVTTLACGLLTVATGWFAGLGILRRKPLDILREIE